MSGSGSGSSEGRAISALPAGASSVLGPGLAVCWDRGSAAASEAADDTDSQAMGAGAAASPAPSSPPGSVAPAAETACSCGVSTVSWKVAAAAGDGGRIP